MEILDAIKYDASGLVPVVVQDFQNGELLMVAYMNRESLKSTLETGKTHFWSRSRQKLRRGLHSHEGRADCGGVPHRAPLMLLPHVERPHI
jgi:phosphoribosyl-AMP cyclohydrolase